MAKAILLLSGGLDSGITGKILLSLGVEVEAVHYTSPFCRCTPKSMGCLAAKRMADQLGIPLRVFPKGEEYWQIVKHPRFGRGSGVNPCIDCRIHTCSLARKRMEEVGADFVATGEVLGQRPMSQHRRAMDLIERESGLAGRLLRPLSAKLFPPTLPERQGLVDRSMLLAIQGRGRSHQIELAREVALHDYPCPAGGCLLTDPQFASRVRDLLAHEPDCRMDDAVLLLHGRHFRLPGGAKVVVGRNEKDNSRIADAVRPGDALLAPATGAGPTALCRPGRNMEEVMTAARLLARYMKNAAALDVAVRREGGQAVLSGVEPEGPASVESWRIASKGSPDQE